MKKQKAMLEVREIKEGNTKECDSCLFLVCVTFQNYLRNVPRGGKPTSVSQDKGTRLCQEKKKVYQIREQKEERRPTTKRPSLPLPLHQQHLLVPSRNKTHQILFQTIKISIYFNYFNSALVDFNPKRKEKHRSNITIAVKKTC